MDVTLGLVPTATACNQLLYACLVCCFRSSAEHIHLLLLGDMQPACTCSCAVAEYYEANQRDVQVLAKPCDVLWQFYNTACYEKHKLLRCNMEWQQHRDSLYHSMLHCCISGYCYTQAAYRFSSVHILGTPIHGVLWFTCSMTLSTARFCLQHEYM
jgi:hypothetical protein